jgi:hypothetical protein
MYIDIVHGYVSEEAIEYIEKVADGNVTSISLNLISGRTVEVTGELARRILEYADRNKVQFVDRLDSPVGLNGISL